MPTITDSIREIANLLDENFNGNLKKVILELKKIANELLIFHLIPQPPKQSTKKRGGCPQD